jgi:hypothetical protein
MKWLTPVRLLAMIVFLLTGCGNDPCAEVLLHPETAIEESAAYFRIPVIEQTNTAGKRGVSIGCVDVSLLASNNYADILLHATLIVRNDMLLIPYLSPGEVDVILDRKGYFPIKMQALPVESGENVWEEMMLMFRYDVPFVIPGEVGVKLTPGTQLSQIAALYNVFEPLRIMPDPEGYQIKLPFRGTDQTRKQTERLCRQLLASPYVQDARPLANLSSIVHGM